MPQNKAKTETVVSPYVASRKVSPVRRETAFEQFVSWSALTTPDRARAGAATQREFAEQHGLSERTLNRWRAMPEYQARVREIRGQWAFGKTSNVLEAIYRTALKGDPRAQLLWLQFFEGFQPNAKRKTTEKPQVEFTVNDICFLIEQLSDERKQKYYSVFAELLDDVDEIKVARDVELEEIDGDAYEQLDFRIREHELKNQGGGSGFENV